MRRGFGEIKMLAETAAKWDLDSEAGYEAFREFAEEAGIKEEQLAYYLNAYQAAGESGLSTGGVTVGAGLELKRERFCVGKNCRN